MKGKYARKMVREDTKQALKGNLQADSVQSRQTLFVRYCLRKHYFHTSPAFSTALSTTCGKQKPWFFAYPFEFMTNIAQFTGIRHQHPVQNSPDRNRFVTGFPLCCGKLC
jgi:hypothetical protein